jgi:hypothetical protein
MFRFSRPVNALAVAIFLLAALFPGAFGHRDAMASEAMPHSASPVDLNDDRQLSDGVMSMTHEGETACRHLSMAACAAGQCCYALPSVPALPVFSGAVFAHGPAVTACRQDNRLEPPPPKLS